MNKFSKELIESLTEACKHAEGRLIGVRIQVAEVPKVPTGDGQESSASTFRGATPRRRG